MSTEEDVIEMREILNEINQRYAHSVELATMKTGEIFPTNVVPILIPGRDKVEARLMSWGFPKWQGPGVIINARAETALEKPLFRRGVERRRCVIPSTGFYEWSHAGRVKDKYILALPATRMLYMAGFYDEFRDKQGQPYQGFVILTTAANESVARIHDRMPVILGAEELAAWTGDAAAAIDMLQRPGPELVLDMVG